MEVGYGTKKKILIQALPQQPLTKKRRGAIIKYVHLKLDGNPYLESAISFTIDAERMRSERLYDWLDRRGYKWDKYRWRMKRR